MRVLAVTTWLPSPGQPSTGTFVVKDAQAIASLGHDVALVHLVPPHQSDAPARERLGGLPVTRVPMSTSRPDAILRARRALAPLVRSADLVHTMAFSALLPMAGARPPVPWVHTEHWSGLTAPQTLPRAWRALLPVLRPLLRGPDVATAVCDYLARPIREVREPAVTAVVPCIVPAPPGGPTPRPADDGEIAMVNVGALVDRKDPLLAVDVVAELVARGRPASIRFVGQGDLADAVVARARDRGVADRVTLVGSLDRAGVLRELDRADLFLGPTKGDNFYVSCAEAIVSGRPVVVGSTGGQGEYIDERVGTTVDVQTAEAYADAVERVLARAEGLSAHVIAATVGDRFEAEQVAAGYQAAYDRAVAVRARRR
ncbi:MAG TPA: glycosyltransferase family 4 protein [Phototrophicaceae bacterium]|nr:glycosyltransferase family 4 protein [Phototrophicaceae bacterium]